MGSEILAIDLADDILSIQKLGFNFIVLTPPASLTHTLLLYKVKTFTVHYPDVAVGYIYLPRPLLLDIFSTVY